MFAGIVAGAGLILTNKNKNMTLKSFCEKYGLPAYENFQAIASDYGIICQSEDEAKEQIYNIFGEPLQQEHGQQLTIIAEPVKEKPKQHDNSNILAMLAGALNPHLSVQSSVNPEQVREIVAEMLKDVKPREIVIKSQKFTSVVSSRQHEAFEKCLKLVSLRKNLYVYGPAGTGKTQMAENIAESLGLSFASISCSQQTTKSDLFGFVDANGRTVKTLFRDKYENGGVFLFDEIDAGNANILVAINSALANGFCAFPDGMIKKHDDFVCIAAANTYGTGANRMFIGRNQLDAATLNRFIQVEINYDNSLECDLFGEKYAVKVQNLRKKLEGERVVLSMRNIANFRDLAESGIFTEAEAFEIAVKNCIPSELHSKI